jgi:phage repressor protein C with HTH and peptisase S24 domain
MRLKAARLSLHREQKEMAEILGISFRSWQDYELGKSVPGGKVFETLTRHGFNANWLLMGEGVMLRADETLVGDEPSLYHVQMVATDLQPDRDGEFVLVPRYEVKASAGGGQLIHSEQIVDYLSFKADWIRNGLGLSEKDLALINVKGDSMEPTLSNEDLILVDMRARQVQDNAVYVLQFNGTLLVKRLQRKFDGSVIVRSDNAIYEPETLKGDQLDALNVVGRVVWCGRRM